MKKPSLFLFLLIFYLISSPSFAASDNIQGTVAPLRITIIVDNTSAATDFKDDWGFSCIIEGVEKTILFDTGNRKNTFFNNLKLKIDPKQVQLLVISHNHFDHIGGLFSFMQARPGIPVFMPYSTPSDLVGRVESAGGIIELVSEPRILCNNVALTGEMKGGIIPEQSLVINTARGLVIIAGCSHQGIIEILQKAKTLYNRPIYMVLGGFHLLDKPINEASQIIARFKELGVENCGASHCTGEYVIPLFREAFGKKFVELGAGRVIEIK